VRRGKFGCMSDFLRNKIFDQSRKKIITLDEKDFPLIKRMDYELNKIGVNLNQIAKKINSQNVSQFTYDDRVVFEQILQEHLNCFSVLQKYMEKVEPGK
ncbi:MAG TPA: plasmid mobilization relaxosome protein MobC, partial [Anaerovoracaceae bacterium]|nr:plasmid mobilization relaxosome protein MobC [Anaerovoracaceae bacterium]